MYIGHRNELKSWRFEGYPFVRVNGGIVGCVWVYMEKVELRYWTGGNIARGLAWSLESGYCKPRSCYTPSQSDYLLL